MGAEFVDLFSVKEQFSAASLFLVFFAGVFVWGNVDAFSESFVVVDLDEGPFQVYSVFAA